MLNKQVKLFFLIEFIHKAVIHNCTMNNIIFNKGCRSEHCEKYDSPAIPNSMISEWGNAELLRSVTAAVMRELFI